MAGQEIPRDAGQPAGVADRRSVLDGDVAPVQTPAAIAAFVARGATEAARTKQEGALADMLAAMVPERAQELSDALRAVMAGASPDDAKALREALLDRTPQPESAMPPDDELADDWRRAAIPTQPDAAQELREPEVQPAGRTAQDAGLGERCRQKLVILFEGRDAAGKGGTIKRFMENLNPRGARIVALEKPSEAERGQWYFQRYMQTLPTAGEIVLFDRSWYNRAGVERVMGFCMTRNTRNSCVRRPNSSETWCAAASI